MCWTAGFRFQAEARCFLLYSTASKTGSNGYLGLFSGGKASGQDVELTTHPYSSGVRGIGTILSHLNTFSYRGTWITKHRRNFAFQLSPLQPNSTVICWSSDGD
jgi:hypothetical protein